MSGTQLVKASVRATEQATVGLLRKRYQAFTANKVPLNPAQSTAPLDEYISTHSASPETVVSEWNINSAGRWAAHAGNLPVVRAVLPFMTKSGHSGACYYAGYYGRNEILEPVLKHALEKQGMAYTLDIASTALREAASGGQLQTVKKITELVPDILNHQEACGGALHNAAAHNKAEGRAIIQYLFEKSPVLQNKSAYITDWTGTKLSAIDWATTVAYHRSPSKEEAVKTDKLISELVRKYQPGIPNQPGIPRGNEFTRSPNFNSWAKRNSDTL